MATILMLTSTLVLAFVPCAASVSVSIHANADVGVEADAAEGSEVPSSLMRPPQEERRVLEEYGAVTFEEMRNKLHMAGGDLQKAADILWKHLKVDSPNRTVGKTPSLAADSQQTMSVSIEANADIDAAHIAVPSETQRTLVRRKIKEKPIPAEEATSGLLEGTKTNRSEHTNVMTGLAMCGEEDILTDGKWTKGQKCTGSAMTMDWKKMGAEDEKTIGNCLAMAAAMQESKKCEYRCVMAIGCSLKHNKDCYCALHEGTSYASEAGDQVCLLKERKGCSSDRRRRGSWNGGATTTSKTAVGLSTLAIITTMA